MKDLTNSSAKNARLAAYPKKRPSPHGITKSRKQSSPLLPPTNSRKVSPTTKLEDQRRRQRQAQVLALHREGVFIEEEYREEIRQYMHEMELCTMGSTSSMDQQPEIKWHMRPCLVDFLVEVHFTFRLRPETLYLALNIVDRYVSRRVVYVKHYQLVGCTALWIAAKFEDAKERVPTVQDLAAICNDTYDESAFTQMEVHVLSTIQWALGHPTAEAWLRFMCSGSRVEDVKVQHVARFLMEITLFHREFVQYTPSAIAHGSLTLARYICDLGRKPFEETEECVSIAEMLDERLALCITELSEVLVKKYSYAFYSKAATFVVDYYCKGGRFARIVPPPLVIPVTPTRTPMSSVASTPASVSTTASDVSDDMPATPMTPSSPLSSDAYCDSYSSDGTYNKENLSSVTTFSPAVAKHCQDDVPDQFLPHDFVTFGRPALHALNASSPRVAAIS